jgi:hypothetical protein
LDDRVFSRKKKTRFISVLPLLRWRYTKINFAFCTFAGIYNSE